MDISKKEIGNLVSQVTLRLEAEDYKPQFDKELKTYKDKAHLKGFRKGKTPLSALKKMYGKGILAEVVNKKISEAFDNYIKENKIDLLGNPIPFDDQEEIDLNVNSFGPLEFNFKIGESPKIEVLGVSESDTYDHYEIVISDELVEEEFHNIRKRYGKEEEVDREVDESDLLNLSVVELDEENIIVEGGIESEFVILFSRMAEKYQKVFKGKSRGTEAVINIMEIEDNVDRNFVSKYLLKVDEDQPFNDSFIATLTSVKRLVPAELDQAFYDLAFGKDKVSNEEEAKEQIREEIKGFYNEQGKSLSEREILEALMEKNTFELPQEFLKEWLKHTNADLKESDLEAEFEGFEKNLRWSLIKSAIAEKANVEVLPEEIKNSMIEKVKKMMAGYNYSGLDYEGMAQRLLQNQEKVREEYEEVFARKIFNHIMETVTLKVEKIGIEEYKEKVNSLQPQN